MHHVAELGPIRIFVQMTSTIRNVSGPNEEIGPKYIFATAFMSTDRRYIPHQCGHLAQATEATPMRCRRGNGYDQYNDLQIFSFSPSGMVRRYRRGVPLK